MTPGVFYICWKGCRVGKDGVYRGAYGLKCSAHGSYIKNVVLVCPTCESEQEISLKQSGNIKFCASCALARNKALAKVKYDRRRATAVVSASKKATRKGRSKKTSSDGILTRNPDCKRYEKCLSKVDWSSAEADRFSCKGCGRYAPRTDNYGLSESCGNSAQICGKLGCSLGRYQPSSGDWG